MWTSHSLKYVRNMSIYSTHKTSKDNTTNTTPIMERNDLISCSLKEQLEQIDMSSYRNENILKFINDLKSGNNSANSSTGVNSACENDSTDSPGNSNRSLTPVDQKSNATFGVPWIYPTKLRCVALESILNMLSKQEASIDEIEVEEPSASVSILDDGDDLNTSVTSGSCSFEDSRTDVSPSCKINKDCDEHVGFVERYLTGDTYITVDEMPCHETEPYVVTEESEDEVDEINDQ